MERAIAAGATECVNALWRMILSGVSTLLAWACLSSVALAAETVHFVTDPEKNGGYLIEITRAAFERVGYKVEIEFVPWARALNSVISGTSEALLGVYYNDARAEKMLYTDSIGTSDLVFFKLKGADIAFTSLDALKTQRIGTIQGAYYTPEFDQAAFLKKDPVSDYRLNIRKLLAGRVSLIVEKRAVVLNALATEFPESKDKIEALEPPLTTARFFNAFARNYPHAEQKVADFNRGLKLIAADGALKAIMDRHLHE